MDQVVAENGFQRVELLPAVNDDFGGIIVEMKERMEPEAFRSQLTSSISLWKLQGKRGVWIKLPIALVNLVETAVQEGFRYHHAEPDYLMLVYWIPETANTLPANATHRVVVGAIVMNDKREIDAEFVEILAFRQCHKAFFDKSDLFFVCMMRPLSFDIQKQESEIEAAQWIQFEEYAAQPFTQRHGLAKYTAEICLAKLDREYVGFSPLPTRSFFDDRISYLYLNSHDLIKK
ncbi:hypothetical protein RHMOL_Rhmol06G0312500 [Rhododendron molle]|uniref:Uncharacterized protein n=1 Tax=Rhododendron molle TaxID=49168 RepID=A0ACC0NKA7_RHOML|nr:hypothetical protein RHMOL_Rhmol06G0312500 [Rhododendron molle]